jgi:hypothetical protein
MDQMVFYDCYNLTSITIPNSLTTIGNAAFSCPKLTSVTVQWNTPFQIDIYSNIFSLVNLTPATLIVPAGTKASYEAASVWGDFGVIKESY